MTNDPRSRSGQNIGLKTDYVLSDRIAFSALLPFIYQNRTTLSEEETSLGLGDLTLITQYDILDFSQFQVALSAGVKLPTGQVSHRNVSRIFLSPDMQSGSGTFDYILRSALNITELGIPFLSMNLSVAFRDNGINNRFGSTETFEGRRFGFGDEWTFISGWRYILVNKHGTFVPDLNVKYRIQEPNTEQFTAAPNSGGSWLSIPVGLSYVFDPNKSARIYAEFPVYQNLNGLQISTSFTAGVQFNYSLSLRQDETLIKEKIEL